MTAAAQQIVGHDHALREVLAAFASGRMHHAWLLTGIEGIGKATLAKQIAHYVLAEQMSADDATKARYGKLVAAETHPDLLIIRRPIDEKTGEVKNIIPVEVAQQIAPFLHKTATYGGWRVVIVDDAHRLNRNGQNAILKIIEEPPPQTLILITVTTPGALLPTIRSRCRLLPLAPLDDAHMRSMLQRTAPQLTEKDMSGLIALSDGSIGFAMKILQSEALPLYHEMLALLVALPQLDVTRLHKLADQIAKKADSENFEVLTALLTDHLRGLVMQEARAGRTEMVGQALEIWQKTGAVFDQAEHGNLDRKLAFINAIGEIRAGIAG